MYKRDVESQCCKMLLLPKICRVFCGEVGEAHVQGWGEQDYYIPLLPCCQLAGGCLCITWAPGLHKRGLPLTWNCLQAVFGPISFDITKVEPELTQTGDNSLHRGQIL